MATSAHNPNLLVVGLHGMSQNLHGNLDKTIGTLKNMSISKEYTILMDLHSNRTDKGLKATSFGIN